MYLVYGLQKSGLSIAKLLQKQNKNFKIWDDNKKALNKIKNNFNSTLFFKPQHDKIDNFKKIFVSPGISIRQNKFKNKKLSIKLNRDLNLYLKNIKNEKIIAITGTNGKSTTTKLIGDILKKSKIKTFVGGNIGEPLCNAFLYNKNFNYHVIELSSFQLETINKINSKISIITNLSNDHLDRYNNISDYVKQKKNIISKNGYNLISIDDKYSKKIFLQKKLSNKISFSITDKSADVFMNDNYILDNYFKKNKKLHVKKRSKDLEGQFNNQNILISYICCKILKIKEKNFFYIINNYRGLPFRSSIILDNKKLKVINNSKSTNINSTINSIINYNQIYLILGGIAKEKNFKILLNYKYKINCVYTFGESSAYIYDLLNKSLKVKKFYNLKSLIKEVLKDTKNNKCKSNILFAPACTSFDQYKNFEDRGKDFTKIFNKNYKKL